MPSSREILEGLARIAQEWTFVAVLWHILLAAFLLPIVKGIWRPSARTAALAASAPLASAAAFAGVSGNAFNAAVLGAGTLTLAAITLRRGHAGLHFGGASARWAGAGMLLFGWLYPHFLGVKPFWYYFFAAPIGLVPCPSLSIAIGLGLYFQAFGSRAWGVIAGLLGLAYGIVGVVRLGVMLDVALVAGAALLFARSVLPHRTQHGVAGFEEGSVSATSSVTRIK